MTTGYLNRDLRQLLAGDGFRLLELDNAAAISIRLAHFSPVTIPRGLYRKGPAVPGIPVKSVGTTALLVAGAEVPDPLVEEAVAALYEEYPHSVEGNPRRQFSRLMNATEAREWGKLPLHAVTQTYFEPYKGLVLLKDFMESIVATKDLLFTLGSGFYVLWL